MNYDGIRAIRIYDCGYRIAVLYQEGRKYDYCLTMSYPIRRTRLTKGNYKPIIFNIPRFMTILKLRLDTYKLEISKEVKELIDNYSQSNIKIL